MEKVITAFVMFLGVTSVYIFINESVSEGIALFVITLILIDFFYRVGLLEDDTRRKI
ncbi:hypothetical protein [Caminibacter pacificus]|uniref:Uncharacterized protein n=1 Tax=Caminibacter pacificus TaxID=1424653 RepID=A0AAJ4RC53_9BACT|nr:hypothetical protein [Caminibacter pacificus]ROR39810.1 hypothetical protein EDC58_0785 [Caminibacter pacificus]